MPPELILLIGECLEPADLTSLILTAGRYPHLLVPVLYNSAFTFVPLHDLDDETEYHEEYLRPHYTQPSGRKVFVNFNAAAIEHASNWKSNILLKYFRSKDVALFTAWDEHGIPLIHRLAQKGAFVIVEDLLKRGADVNMGAVGDYTPLGWVVDKMSSRGWIANMPLIRMFVAHRANVLTENHWRQTLLFQAVKSAPAHVVSYFIGLMLDAGGNIWKSDIFRITPLWQAIKWGNCPAVRVLLEHGADVLEQDATGCAALHKAAHKGDAGILKAIIAAVQKSGGDLAALNHRHCNALHVALNFYKERAATLLIEAGLDCTLKDDTDNTPLDMILHTEMKDAFNALIEHTSHLWPLQKLRRTQLVDTVTYCKAAGFDMMMRLIRLRAVTPFDPPTHEKGVDTVLHKFCTRWSRVPDPMRFASSLLELGERPDAQGVYNNTPLHLLLFTRTANDDSKQYLDLLRRLLSGCKRPFTFANDSGNTILHYAAAQSDLRVVQLVTDHIESRTFFALNKAGFTALHCVANPRCEKSCRLLAINIIGVSNCFPSKPVIDFLVSRGLNVEAKSNRGRTALHMACSDPKKAAAVEGLIRAGADIGMPDYSGHPPLHWANTHGCDDAVEILLDAGADLHEECYTCDPRLVHLHHEGKEKLEELRGASGHWISEVLNEMCASST